MARKKGRSTNKKAQNQTSGRRTASTRRSSTSTSTDFNNDQLLVGIDRLNLNEEDENFFINILSNNKLSRSQHISNQPKGLVNLGNTCYLNSVIQVLSQTPLFYESLNKRADKFVAWNAIHKDYFKYLMINHKLPNDRNSIEYQLSCKLSAPSILISCLISLLRNLRSELKSSPSIITPSNFVREISSSFSQFKNFDQQDSHEFLRCLLDAIRISEIGRQRKGIIESLGLDLRKIKQLKEDSERSNEIKAYSDSSNFTLVDSLFGGYCISSLKCQECQFTSQIFESFFDLSLPISEESDIDNHSPSLNRKLQNSHYHHSLKKHQLKEKKNSRTSSLMRKATVGVNENDEKESPDNNLDKLDVKSLNPKQRKLRRQLKKDAKRENKKIKLINRQQDQIEDSEDAISDSMTGKDEDQDKNRLLVEDNRYHMRSSIVGENEESDGESSDDEASSNECSEIKNDLSEECSIKATPVLANDSLAMSSSSKTVTSNNSVDSGINSSNLTSEVDSNTAKIRNLINSISPVHEESTDCEATCANHRSAISTHQSANKSDKESDTGFEDRNAEADSESEESNSANNDHELEDSDQENENEIKNHSTTNWNGILDNDKVFESENEERKSVRSSSAMESSDLFKRRIKWTLSTVSTREDSSISCSVLTGLAAFTKIELLVGANKILCENCSLQFKKKNGQEKKIYTNGSKQMLIALPPPILTLQLKRFGLKNYRSIALSKINKFVSFPLVFDLSPFVSNVYKKISSLVTGNSEERNSKSMIYSLYGIIEHSGSLRYGHYKAYVKCNNKDSDDLEKFIRLQSYVPKIADLMDLITLDDIEKVEEDQDLNEMLQNMHLHSQTNGDSTSNENLHSVNDDSETNSQTNQLIKEELIKATKERWFHISDTQVTSVPLQSLLKAQAYLLFYERKS